MTTAATVPAVLAAAISKDSALAIHVLRLSGDSAPFRVNGFKADGSDAHVSKDFYDEPAARTYANALWTAGATAPLTHSADCNCSTYNACWGARIAESARTGRDERFRAYND